jgi:hypothetical protein
MMGERTPETCRDVNKRQVIYRKKLLHLVGDLLELFRSLFAWELPYKTRNLRKDGRMEVTGRRGRRRKKLPNDPNKKGG